MYIYILKYPSYLKYVYYSLICFHLIYKSTKWSTNTYNIVNTDYSDFTNIELK